MDTYQPLFDNFARFVKLNSTEKSALAKIIRTTRVRKKQFIVHPGFVCQHRNYVLAGAFRAFYLDDDGREHTLQIAVEDWFISDFYSYISQSPATLFVEALENSTILQMSYDDIEALCGEFPSIGEYFRKTTERAFAFSRRRVISNISKDAETRYFEYLDKYPHIAARVPQYILASYLGMSAEFLSKIRARKAPKQKS